jgi:hypothetical protein
VWAGTEAKAPLNEPTGVRAAETITTSSTATSLGNNVRYVSQIAAIASPAVETILHVEKQWVTVMLRSIFMLRLLKSRWTAGKE